MISLQKAYQVKKLELVLLLMAISGVCWGQDCKSVKKHIDKFTGKVIYASYINESVFSTAKSSAISTLAPEKIITKDDTTYQIRVGKSTLVHPSVSDKKNAIFLFSDGDKLEIQDVSIISSSAGTQTYLVATIPVEKNDFELLGTKIITDIRIGISDGTVSEKMAKTFKEMTACVAQTW